MNQDATPWAWGVIYADGGRSVFIDHGAALIYATSAKWPVYGLFVYLRRCSLGSTD